MNPFDPEKTKAFFGFATDYIDKFRDSCLSTIYDNPEAIAHTLRPLKNFGLWNIPGLEWPGRERDTFTFGEYTDQQTLLHDAIFRSEEAGARYPLLDSSFSRAGITKFFMLIEQSGGDFYPQRWFNPELLMLARTSRSFPDASDDWKAAARAVIEKLVTQPWDKRVRDLSYYPDFDVVVAFVAPTQVIADWEFDLCHDDLIDTTGAHGSHHVARREGAREAMMPYIDFVRDVLDELTPVSESMPPVTGFEPEDVSPLVPPNGNGGHKHSPSISMLAGHFGETLIGPRSADPLRELFERTQAMPKHEIHGRSPDVHVSQIVIDTVSLVSQLINIPGVTADKALDTAVQLLKPTPSKGD